MGEAIKQRAGEPLRAEDFGSFGERQVAGVDGRGRWRDNVLVERIWRSIKYEEVYLHAYDSVAEARASIGRYFEFTTQ